MLGHLMQKLSLELVIPRRLLRGVDHILKMTQPEDYADLQDHQALQTMNKEAMFVVQRELLEGLEIYGLRTNRSQNSILSLG